MLVVTSVTANIVSATGFAAGIAGELPSPLLPLLVLVFGCTGLWLLHRFVLAGSTAQAKGSMLAVTLALTLLVTYWTSNHAWPDRFPLGSRPKETNPTARAEAAASADAKASLTRGLKVTGPRNFAHIGTCTAVTGIGEIPKGYQVWVANLNDHEGIADRKALFNLRRVTHEGGGEWSTDRFGVGTKSDVRKNFWIFVYLLPDSVGSVLDNLIKPAKDPDYNPSLSAPITGFEPFAEVPVLRIAKETC